MPMKHLQAFVTPSSLVPLIQELRDVPGMPEITIRHGQNAHRQEEVVIHSEVPDELVAPVVEIIRSHSDCLVVVAPQDWMNNPANQTDLARVVEVLPERIDGALHHRSNHAPGARPRVRFRRG